MKNPMPKVGLPKRRPQRVFDAFPAMLLICALAGCAANFAQDGRVSESIGTTINAELPDGSPVTLPDPGGRTELDAAGARAVMESCARRVAGCGDGVQPGCTEAATVNCIRDHHPICPAWCAQ